jgi:GDSL-like Lipase/Acylhydrolase family/N-terminus of Esterase_SGNH_hydro-type
MRLAFALFALFAPTLAAQATEAQYRWLPATSSEFTVDGLPWFKQNQGELVRLPLSLEKVVRPPVWNLAKSPSGGRIRFRSDASSVAIRLEYPSAPNMANMHAFGQTGVDLYIGDVYVTSVIADKEAAPGKTYEKVLFRGMPKVDREITLYLPLYKPVKVLGIGIGPGAAPEARIARPHPYARPRPVVFYGTSITQGGCASRSGMSYQAILGRMLNLDFVNLGFSGNGMGEPELARAVADIDAAAYVLDFAQNNRTTDDLAKVYAPFLEIIRAKHPEIPILAITPIYSSREATGDNELQKMRDHIRQVVSKAIAAGDRNLQLVEGTDLLGPAQGDGLVDGSHPNDLGFQYMATGLSTRLRKFLGL